jgi:hypothetical protein
MGKPPVIVGVWWLVHSQAGTVPPESQVIRIDGDQATP